MLSLPLFYEHSSKKKPFLTFPILNNFALLKITLIKVLLPIFSNFIIFNIIFLKILLSTQTKKQIRIYSLFLRVVLETTSNNVGILISKTPALSSPLEFSRDEPLPFLATSENHHFFFYSLRDFPVTHFTYLTYDNHSIDKS